MRLAQLGAQSVLVGAHEDQIDVVVHQARGETASSRSIASLSDKVELIASVSSENNTDTRRVPWRVTWCGTFEMTMWERRATHVSWQRCLRR
ncbi:hypothetical protein GCM10011411_25200 [Aurantiacibacter arachoides]|nr:hypothetical protein GCM10011411_25200 [Aurantiacibacter arachoides]